MILDCQSVSESTVSQSVSDTRQITSIDSIPFINSVLFYLPSFPSHLLSAPRPVNAHYSLPHTPPFGLSLPLSLCQSISLSYSLLASPSVCLSVCLGVKSSSHTNASCVKSARSQPATQSDSQRVGKSFSQPVGQSAKQPVSQPASQSVSRSASPTTERGLPSMHLSVSRSTRFNPSFVNPQTSCQSFAARP